MAIHSVGMREIFHHLPKLQNGEKERRVDMPLHISGLNASAFVFTVGLNTVSGARCELDSRGKIHQGCVHPCTRSTLIAAARWVSEKGSCCYLSGSVCRRGRWTLTGSDKLRKRKGVTETCVINQNSIDQAKRRRCKIGCMRDNLFRRGKILHQAFRMVCNAGGNVQTISGSR